jgi:hypothetical protein
MQNVPFASQQEQVNKFLQANRVLGAQMDQMQGTTRVIYDTRPVSTGTNVTVNFFDGVAGRSAAVIDNQVVTNIQDNRFEPGEGMVIKEFGFYNTDTNATDSTTPLPVQTSVVTQLALLNFYIGNNRVIKDLPLFAGGDILGINNLNMSTSSTTNLAGSRYLGFRLLTNIVIPPQIQFYATLLLPFGGGTGANLGFANLRMYVKGYGKLFNPRNNY